MTTQNPDGAIVLNNISMVTITLVLHSGYNQELLWPRHFWDVLRISLCFVLVPIPQPWCIILFITNIILSMSNILIVIIIIIYILKVGPLSCPPSLSSSLHLPSLPLRAPLTYPLPSYPHQYPSSLGHQISTRLSTSFPTEATQGSPLLHMCPGHESAHISSCFLAYSLGALKDPVYLTLLFFLCHCNPLQLLQPFL